MKRIMLIVICLMVLWSSVPAKAAEAEEYLTVLRDYGLIESEGWQDVVEEFKDLIQELQTFSSNQNMFVDLIDTLLKYSQANQLKWQRHDLGKIAWTLKELHEKILERTGFAFSTHFQTGYELEVIHNHSKAETPLYKNPFKHDLDGDGEIDVYDEDEYMRQYLRGEFNLTGPQIEGAVKILGVLKYFGSGFLGENARYQRQYDLELPRIEDMTFSLYGPHFTATVGSEQILGLRDYLYHDDPENPADYNLSGITLQAPYGIFFGLGQEMIPYAPDQTENRDIRWIALGIERIGRLPVNLYITEQEFQNLDFHKVGRNVVFALTSDLVLPGVEVSADLAVNDSGDGVFTRVMVEGQIEKLTMHGKYVLADHFTPIQPIGGFTNTTHTRTFYDGERYVFPALTERGVEIRGIYEIIPELQLYGKMEKYVDSHEYGLGMNYQVMPELMVHLNSKYDLEAEGIITTEMESSYIQPYGTLYARKVLGGTGDLELKAEPMYAGNHVTVKGLFGFGMRPGTELRNTQMGVEVSYHPVQNFCFQAKYVMEEMDYNVDIPGLNFTRNGKIEYRFNEWVTANVQFENIEFRNPQHGYLVEYSKAGVSVDF